MSRQSNAVAFVVLKNFPFDLLLHDDKQRGLIDELSHTRYTSRRLSVTNGYQMDEQTV